MTPLDRTPVDEWLAAATGFDRAVDALIAGYRREEAHFSDEDDRDFWSEQIERAELARQVYRRHVAAAVAELRAAELDEFADGLESGISTHLAS
jgi:hypothetical protein